MKLRHAFGAMLALQMLVGVSIAEAQGRRSRNLITSEEIAKASAADAYDLIRELRPAWLSSRGVVSGDAYAGGIVIYLDGIKQNSVEDIKAIAVERIKEARFYSASDATTKFGTGHPSGAIEITTKR